MNTALGYRANIFAQSVPTFEEGKILSFYSLSLSFWRYFKTTARTNEKGKE